MNKKLSPTDSQALYFVKAVAILSAVAAHASVIDTTTRASTVITCLWDIFSCLSIGCFLITGGILYTRAPGDSLKFWKHKSVTIILPWVFCASLTCAIRALCGHGVDLWGYFRWILGDGTWYYYVTIYLFMLAFFKPICNCGPALWGCVAVNALVLALRAKNIDLFAGLGLSDYLNPLHWFGFFALGILLRRRELKLSKGFFAVCCLVFAVSLFYVYRNGIFTYFHIANAIYAASGFFVLFGLGRLLSDSPLSGIIRELGATTYCVYLLHMQIVQSVARKVPLGLFHHLFIPLVGMAVMMVLVELGKWITRKLPLGKYLRMLVGLR